MFSGDRADGKLVRNASTARLFMPYIMPRRSDAAIYMKQKIDVSQTQDYLKRWNDGTRPWLRLYHIYLAACVRMLADRPLANRFIAGRRLYQRNDIAISMSVLRARGDDGSVSTIKQIYDPAGGLRAVQGLTDAIIIGTSRDQTQTIAEREMELVSRLPRWMIPGLLKLQKLGDWLNVTPASLAANDPLYASMLISFNGSVGLDSVYHHPFEHGTVPVIGIMGPVRDEPVVIKGRGIEVRPVMTVRYTTDERVTEGHYAASALRLHQKLVEKPWLMETPDDDGPGAPSADATATKSKPQQG